MGALRWQKFANFCKNLLTNSHVAPEFKIFENFAQKIQHQTPIFEKISKIGVETAKKEALPPQTHPQIWPQNEGESGFLEPKNPKMDPFLAPIWVQKRQFLAANVSHLRLNFRKN